MFRRSSKVFILFFSFLFMIYSIINVLYSLFSGPTFEEQVASSFETWHKCVTETFREKKFNTTGFWYGSPAVFDSCRKSTNISSHFNVTEFENRDEVKLYAMPRNKTEKSVHLSLGIGHDIEAELKVKSALPNSVFFGADPESAINQELFSSQLGPFFATAVGNASGVFEALILPEQASSLTDYHKRNVKKIDLTYLVKNYVKVDLFDNVFIDIEFDEYDLFTYFHRDGVLERTKIVFCQFNLEVHEGTRKQKEEFRRFLMQILDDKRYLVYQDFLLNHHRLFLINFHNQTCLHKYFS